MGPDPEKIHNNSNFDQSDYVINQPDDEMDIDFQEINNEGYFMLNQDGNSEYPAAFDDDDSDYSDNDDQNDEIKIDQIQQLPENTPNNIPLIRSSSTELVTSVWNNSNSSNSIEITAEKSREITEIMNKINLPNAPSWLNEISSENILNRIKNKNTGSSDSAVHQD